MREIISLVRHSQSEYQHKSTCMLLCILSSKNDHIRRSLAQMTIQLDTALERLLNYIRNWRMGLRKFSPFQDSLVEAELFCTSRILPDLLSVSMKLHFVWSRYIKSDTIICRPSKDYLWWYRTVLRFWDPSLYGMWNVYGEGDKASTGVVNVIRYAAHR